MHHEFVRFWYVVPATARCSQQDRHCSGQSPGKPRIYTLTNPPAYITYLIEHLHLPERILHAHVSYVHASGTIHDENLSMEPFCFYFRITRCCYCYACFLYRELNTPIKTIKFWVDSNCRPTKVLSAWCS